MEVPEKVDIIEQGSAAEAAVPIVRVIPNMNLGRGGGLDEQLRGQGGAEVIGILYRGDRGQADRGQRIE